MFNITTLRSQFANKRQSDDHDLQKSTKEYNMVQNPASVYFSKIRL